MKILLAIIIAILSSNYLLANEFIVIGVSGKVQYKEKSNNWLNAKVNQKLSQDASIKLEKSSSIGLMYKKNGRSLELKNKGTYKLKDFTKQLNSKSGNLNKKFSDYVINEMSDIDNLLEKKDYRKSMDNAGMVERVGGSDVDLENSIAGMVGIEKSSLAGLQSTSSVVFGDGADRIIIRFPSTSYIIDNNIIFSWYKADSDSYEFYLKNDRDSLVFKQKVVGTFIEVDLAKAGVKPGECYYWYVKSGKKISNENCIYQYPENERNRILSDIAELSDEPESMTPIDRLILAAYYEDENIINRAIREYESAIKSAPNSDSYRKIYAKYLHRIGLEREVELILAELQSKN